MYEPGIEGQLAPDYSFQQAIGPQGRPLERVSIEAMPGRFKILFGFQDACPGCHSRGFPALTQLVSHFRKVPEVSFLAVQSVFEEFEHNTRDKLEKNQASYALEIPFAHDDGAGKGSPYMQKYRCGGTPWFVVIDEGVVIANGFQLSTEALIAHIDRELSKTTPLGVFRWVDVLRSARDGNPAPPGRIEKTREQWQAQLTEEQFRVTRANGTERAFSSELCSLFSPGKYECACCGTTLFDSSAKFESGTGWPSFTGAAAPNVVSYHEDTSLHTVRIETRCNVCDAHVGHVFPDGPPPSGLRYCINAVALRRQE